MTEEIKTQEVIENTDEQKQTEQTPQPSTWEIKASEQGWKPKDQWEGDPEDWRPAKEFVERGELFTKISGQSSEIKELRKALNYLVDHHQKVKETEYNRAYNELKKMKKEALVDGDPDRVVEIDEAMQTLKDEQKKAEGTAAPKTNAPTPKFVDFVRNNAWYVTNPAMRAYADKVGVTYFNTNPTASEDETYEFVKEQVRKQFKSEFEPTKKTAPAVEGTGRNGSGSTSSVKEYPLTEDERRTMMTFVRSGVMSKETYIEELRKIKGE